jgi:hypothetical protein
MLGFLKSFPIVGGGIALAQRAGAREWSLCENAGNISAASYGWSGRGGAD